MKETNSDNPSLPINDTFVEMLKGATEYKFNENFKKGDYANISGVIYEVKEVIKTGDGMQAIIFQCTGKNSKDEEILDEELIISKGSSVLAIGGSYPVKKPFPHIGEWYKDWGLNNSQIAQKRIPPQFYTAFEILDKYKKEYNIRVVTGYSLGAIIAGMISRFSCNSDIKAYLYNGGLPVKMEELLMNKYPNAINPDSSNIITMLSQDEPLTNGISIVQGSGIYLSKHGDKEHKGHRLHTHRGLSPQDYCEIEQKGLIWADEMTGSTLKTNTGIGKQINIPLVLNKPYKQEITKETSVNYEKEEQPKKVIKSISKPKQMETWNSERGEMEVPITYTINRVKREYPPSPLALREQIEDVIYDVLDDFCRYKGFNGQNDY